MTRYAQGTEVSVERSRAETERLLIGYGASEFAYSWRDRQATIEFALNDRRIRLTLPLPSRDASEFARTPTGKQRATTAQRQAWEQACRQRWRALTLVVKAKLEAIDAGITTVEDEWLAHVVLPDGSTVGEWATPYLTAELEAPVAPYAIEARR